VDKRSDQLGEQEYMESVETEDVTLVEPSPEPLQSTVLGDPHPYGEASAWPVDSMGNTGTGRGDEGDMDEPADEVVQTRQQIEQTRSEMSETIDAIEQKLSPGRIAQDAKDAVRDATIGKAQNMVDTMGNSARDMSSGFLDTIKRNPVPAALAGFGLGWLLMSGRKSSGNGEAYYPRERYWNGQYSSTGYSAYGGYEAPTGYDDSPGMVGRVGDSAGRAAGQVQDAAGQAVQSAQDTAGQVAGQIQQTAGQMANQAQYGMQQAQSGFQQMMHENPLAVAAGAIAVGLAVGLAIPETPQEDQLMGPMHDQIMQEAQQMIGEKAQQVQQAAQQAIGAAQSAAEDSLQNSAG